MKIRNKQTGEVKEIAPSQAGQYGLSIMPSGSSKQPAAPQAPLSGLTHLLSSLGLGSIPMLGSAASDVFNAVKSGNPGGYDPTQSNAFYTGSEKQNLAQNPVGNAAKAGAGLAGWLLPFTKGLTPFAGAGFKAAAGNGAVTGGASGGLVASSQDDANLSSVLGGVGLGAGAGAAAAPLMKLWMTGLDKGTVGKNLEKQAAKGGSMSWDTLQTEIKNKVLDKLGDSAENTKAVDRFVSHRVPQGITKTPVEGMAPLEKTPSLNPDTEGLFQPTSFSGETPQLETPDRTGSNLLKMRQQLDARYNRPFYSKIFQKESLDEKIATVARSVIRDNLHKIAPGTITPDQVFTLYSKGGIFGGDIPHLLLKYGLAGLVGKSALGGLVGRVTNQMGQ